MFQKAKEQAGQNCVMISFMFRTAHYFEVNAVVGRVACIAAVRLAHVIFVNRKRSGRTFEGSNKMSLTGKRLSGGGLD